MLITQITTDSGAILGLGDDNKMYIWSAPLGDWELLQIAPKPKPRIETLELK